MTCQHCRQDSNLIEVAVLANAKSFVTTLYRCGLCGGMQERHNNAHRPNSSRAAQTQANKSGSEQVHEYRVPTCPEDVRQEVQVPRDMKSPARRISWKMNGPRITQPDRKNR